VRQSEIDVLEIDRQMRQSVHETGKRPRDEYSEAMNYIVKKYRASSDQQEVVVQFPSFNAIFGIARAHFVVGQCSILLGVFENLGVAARIASQSCSQPEL